MREFVAFDLETTGLFAEADRVVEIGAVRFDGFGRELGRFESLVRPGRPVGASARAVHGLGDHELAEAPLPEIVLPAFLAFVGDPHTTTLLAHNAAFDAGFLGAELTRLDLDLPAHRVVDTLPLARDRLASAPDFRLDTLARLLNLDTSGAHRALADAQRVRGLWLALGGDSGPDAPLLSYPIFDPRKVPPVPTGWDALAVAMADNRRVRLEYSGGTRGAGPRDVTPRRFAHRGGTAYVVAECHIDGQEKSFRLDRVLRFEVLDGVTA